VCLLQYVIRAGVGYANITFAFVDGALVFEEFQGVVEDFYGVGGGLDKLLRGLVEAISLEGIGDLEHKIPVDFRIYRMLLNNEIFVFTGHFDVL
jgi:hypothetical protein